MTAQPLTDWKISTINIWRHISHLELPVNRLCQFERHYFLLQFEILLPHCHTIIIK